MIWETEEGWEEVVDWEWIQRTTTLLLGHLDTFVPATHSESEEVVQLAVEIQR